MLCTFMIPEEVGSVSLRAAQAFWRPWRLAHVTVLWSECRTSWCAIFRESCISLAVGLVPEQYGKTVNNLEHQIPIVFAEIAADPPPVH